ncbi:MAG: branched-chain amino acid ABC transporter permease [Castellaniella sp.]
MAVSGRAWSWVLLGVLVLFPLTALWLGDDFYVSWLRRVLIFAIAATSLNLVLGYGGLVALGHAAFFGAGAYGVVILSAAGLESGLLIWPAAALLAGMLAWLVGAISLRTRGVYFIMITLAFAQMVYYFFISLRQFGGEDGVNLYARSRLPLVDTEDELVFYYLVLLCFVLVSWLFGRLVESRFGKALAGVRENAERMEALGYPVQRLQLCAFVLSGVMAGLAGALLADHNLFVSPGMMHWTQSAHLVIMVLVGGMGLRHGGAAGAIVMLTLEEILRQLTEFWHLPLGVMLLLIVFFAPRGLAGLGLGVDRKAGT